MKERSTKKVIVILFTGHVGSSWLISLLDHHKAIRQLGFEPVDDLNEIGVKAAPFIEQILKGVDLAEFPDDVAKILGKKYESVNESKPLEWDRKSNGSFDYIAFKTRVTIQLQRSLFTELLPKIKPVLILLRRKNKIKNAVSQFKRTQLDISHLQDLEKFQLKRQPVDVDSQYILNQAMQFTHRELRTKHYFHLIVNREDVSGFEVCYEDLMSETKRSRFFNHFFEKIGLEYMPLQSDYRKITSDSLEAAVHNYEDLKEKISGTIFEPSLHDDEFDIVREIYSGTFPFPSLETDKEFQSIDRLLR